MAELLKRFPLPLPHVYNPYFNAGGPF
jgi:hypothetical protein